MSDRIWTVSNGLSLLRLLLVVPVGLLLHAGSPGDRLLAAALIAGAALTDYLDGLVARLRDQVTRLGVILDPLADKIGIGAVAVLLTVEGTLPLWFTAAVIGRDAAILAAAAVLSQRGGATPRSNALGKWTAAALGAALFLGVLDPADAWGLRAPALAAGSAMLLLSSLSYARRLSA